MEKMLYHCGFQIIKSFRIPFLGNSVRIPILYSLVFRDLHSISIINLLIIPVITLVWPINLIISFFPPDSFRVIAQKKVHD